jgi:uncharacterized protein (DUF488 family)
VRLATIGFAGWSARLFFTRLAEEGIRQLGDVRLRTSSQLSGFAKRDDLAWFLDELVGASYLHLPELAPTAELLDAYRRRELTWESYERRYLALLADRAVEDRIDRRLFEVPTVLLCSEHEPERCHRRLAVEYLDERWGGVEAVHL